MKTELKTRSVYILTAACPVLVTLHLSQERYVTASNEFVNYFFLWTLAPALNLTFFVVFKRWLRDSSEALGLSLFFCSLTALFLYQGESDPNTAGHMHLIIVPAFFFLVLSIIYALVLAINFARFLKRRLRTKNTQS